MFYVSKRMEIAGAHRLKLSYGSPCSNLHGHNWVVVVHCKSKTLNKDGMVVDFAKIKKAIHGALDHQFINEIVSFNPTAENIAKWIAETVTDICKACGSDGSCYKVEVQESEGNIAIYEED